MIGSVSMDTKKLDSGSKDLISFLPNEVLGNILSLLPTKFAASTSILSKKWRNVFALRQNLDFDDSVLLHPEERKHERRVIRDCFRNFVDRTLALQCDSSIKKLSLKYYNDDDNEMLSYVAPWIRNVLERGVVELYLTIKLRYITLDPPRIVSHGCTFLPYELFTSKTLVKLSLGKKFNLRELPPDMCLPVLKSLLIDSIHFHYGDLCDVLLAGCPLLEDLVVCHKDFEAIPYCISSRTIKKLSVQYDCDDNFGLLSSMSFDAPSLLSLDYSDFALPEYTVHLESLVEAKLHLRYTRKVKSPDVTDLINGLSNVEILHLSPDAVDVIFGCVKNGLLLPLFDNLISLSFGSKNKRDWILLLYLIEQSPNLETLIIQGLDGYASKFFMPMNQVKELHIIGYGGTAAELEHLKSFLGESKGLELVQVELDEAVEDDAIILQTERDLMKLRGVSVSSKCKIKVISTYGN